MAGFSSVPVVDIHNENFHATWPSLLLAVHSSTFIGVDLELSGLGDRKKLSARSIDDRYDAICEVAKTRSILSFGISCFKLQDVKTAKNDCQLGEPKAAGDEEGGAWSFLVQTFNISLLCAQNYVVEPLSLKFLVDHGFDFNRQYSCGISYNPGNDKENSSSTISIRNLFSEIVLAKKPMVLHNALIDLVFMYHSFYASLPPNLNTFLADLSEVFSAGVFDTKYITEFSVRLPASYLEYVFRKSQRENAVNERSGRAHVALDFVQYPPSNEFVTHLPCSLLSQAPTAPDGNHDSMKNTHQSVCENFAAHGWCVQGKICPHSHDIDAILDSEDVSEEKKRKRKRRRKNKYEKDVNEETPGDSVAMETEQSAEDRDAEIDTIAECEDISSLPKTIVNSENTAPKPPNICIKGGHRAGFDAFMTGFSFACIVAKHGKCPSNLTEPSLINLSSLDSSELNNFMNRICLTGKDIPLQIVKSNFSKTSKDHREKLLRLKEKKY